MDVRPGSGGAFDTELAVEGDDAVGETTQAGSACRVGTPDTVVFDVDENATVHVRDANAHVCGVRVLRSVRQRLRDEEVRGRLGRPRQTLVGDVDDGDRHG